MSLENGLKKHLPEAQQGNIVLDEYLEASGKLLDGLKAAIDNFKHYSDYEKIDSDLLDTFGEQFGINFPRNLADTKKRDMIKDAVKLYKTNGTLKSLTYIFKLIGWDVDVDYYWTLNPAIESDFNYRYNGGISYVEGTSATYTNSGTYSPVGSSGLIFGNENIYDNGVYADLYDISGQTYDKWSIVGEYYKEDADDVVPKIIKTPYIRINVNQEDYDLFTSDYTDPDTGEVYSYTSSEIFQITQEIINYFLDTSRPANVAIREITTPFVLQDTIDHTIDDSDLVMDSELTSPAIYDGTISYGMEIDRYVLGEVWGGFEYGTTAGSVVESPLDFVINRSYPMGSHGLQPYIPTRKNATLDITVPADATIILYRSENTREKLSQGDYDWIIVGSYTNVTNQIVNISDSYAVGINIFDPSESSSIDIEITEKS